MIRFLLSVAVVATVAVVDTNPANAATFRRLCDLEDKKGMQCTIELTGEIRSGDANRLRTMLFADKSRIGDDRFLLLDSQGGDIREALRLGEIVKSAMLTTTLVRLADMEVDERNNRNCISACFLVYLAGAERKAMWGRIGVHRPYFDPQAYRSQTPLKVSRDQLDLEEAVRVFARAHGASDQLIGKMMAHSSRDVYWLSQDEQSALDGEQSWYQEIMIASCQHDPSREAAIYRRWLAGGERAQNDRDWLSRTYACINARIAQAQRSLAR